MEEPLLKQRLRPGLFHMTMLAEFFLPLVLIHFPLFIFMWPRHKDRLLIGLRNNFVKRILDNSLSSCFL